MPGVKARHQHLVNEGLVHSMGSGGIGGEPEESGKDGMGPSIVWHFGHVAPPNSVNYKHWRLALCGLLDYAESLCNWRGRMFPPQSKDSILLRTYRETDSAVWHQSV